MKYDLHNELRRKSFAKAVKKAWEAGAMVDFSTIAPKTKNQNSYLHVCLTYIAKETEGSTDAVSMEYVKQVLYKKAWNREIFEIKKVNIITGEEETFWRSTASLSKDETRISIDNLIKGAQRDLDIFVPPPEDESLVEAMYRYVYG